MAKVKSQFALSGTIADLTFRQTMYGPIAQCRPGPSREQVLNSDKFRFTRLNAGIFRKVTQDGKLLRKALRQAIDSVRHPNLNGMMIKMLYTMAKTDKHSRRPCRHAAAGEISLMEGFEFNHQLSLDQALPVKVTHNLDVASGVMQLELPAFIERRKKGFPKEATHFRIVSCGVVVDFESGKYRNDAHTSDLLPLGKQTPTAIRWEHQLKAAPGEVMVHVLAIEFYKVVPGKITLLKWGAAKILQAARMKEGSSGSDKPALQHTPGVNKVVDPYATMDYLELANRVFRQLPVQDHPFFTNNKNVTCCHDPVVDKLPDIA
jgi:hypothetical protein